MNINQAFKSPFSQVGSLSDLVTTFLNIAFVLAGIIILVFFIMGGIGMIAGAGSGDSQKAEQAKKTVTSALIGFIIVFTSYWIVKLIGTIVGVDII